MDALADALLAAPRRYRLPPLPADVASARAAPLDLALAFSIECARTGELPGARDLFVASLAALVAAAQRSDPAFQAVLLQAEEPSVREYLSLRAQAARDVRAVRRLVDALAHPAKPAGGDPARQQRLAQLHALARQARWSDLRGKAAGLADALAGHPALLRLERAEHLHATPAIARHAALLAAQGPLAGSDAASRRGRAAAAAGDLAEAQTVAVLEEIAALLRRQGRIALQVARALKTPPAFPGERGKAKDEWDVALVEAGRLALLGEVKASPAAAPADFARLHRGLLHLAQAEAGRDHVFSSADGPVAMSGASLRALAPPDRGLPPQVVYFCTAPGGQVLPPLAAASKAVLLREPASLAFARTGDAAALDAVWTALRTEPRLRATLHQYETAQRVCAALLHPGDLLQALQERDGQNTADPATFLPPVRSAAGSAAPLDEPPPAPPAQAT